MHTPLIIQTAFTAAALFGAAQAAPVRRGSVVEDNLSPSSPSSRRGSMATDEIVSSRRSSIVDPMLGAPPSRRGSLAGDLPAPGSRRRSVVEEQPASPAGRRASLASPADIVNARRRSLADEALPNARRSSGASAADIAAARRRSAIDDGQPARRSSLAVPTSDALGSRRRSFAAGDSVPLRRSSLAVESLPNRKAYIPEQQHEEAVEGQEEHEATTFTPEIKLAAGNPAALPNRKAYIPTEAAVKAPEVKIAPINLPNRKAYVFPEALAPKTAETADTPAAARIKQVHPASLPNRKAYVFPEVKVSDEDEPSKAPQAAIKQVDPASLPNRKAFVFPIAPASSPSTSQAAVENAQIKQVNAFAIPNRKAFITPEDAGIAHSEDVAPEDEESFGPAETPMQAKNVNPFASWSPAATPMQMNNVNPFSIPNRKAFITPESAGVKTSDDVAPEDTIYEEPEQIEEDAEAVPSTESKAVTGTSIPLRKRQINPLATAGVLNWDAAEAHLNHIDIKYEKGTIAYQKQTGEALFGSKLFTPDELYERETRLARRAAALDAEEELDVPEDVEDEDLQTIDEAFAAMASEFAVGNPKSQMLQQAKASKRAGVKLQAHQSDLLWSGPVQIGTPGQPFVLDFDTGSADTWVPSVNCQTSACASHNKYDPSKSSTSDLQEGKKLAVQYGDGSTTTGVVYKDTVTVAGVTATGQTIGVATKLSDSFKDDPMDGIMGMGYQSISQMNVPPFFQTLMKKNQVSNSQFSFNLESAGSEVASELYLGGANPNMYQGDIEWHPVVSESYWVLNGEAQVDKQKAADDFYAIIDTGTTVVVAPPAQAEAFWDKVEGSAPYGGGYYTFPCNNVPEVSFSFGGKQWQMSEENVNLGSTHSGSGRCVGSVVGRDVGINAWIVGDSFLKDVYTTFDFDKNAVGFSEKKEED